jgi:hypothetical protein
LDIDREGTQPAMAAEAAQHGRCQMEDEMRIGTRIASALALLMLGCSTQTETDLAMPGPGQADVSPEQIKQAADDFLLDGAFTDKAVVKKYQVQLVSESQYEALRHQVRVLIKANNATFDSVIVYRALLPIGTPVIAVESYADEVVDRSLFDARTGEPLSSASADDGDPMAIGVDAWKGIKDEIDSAKPSDFKPLPPAKVVERIAQAGKELEQFYPPLSVKAVYSTFKEKYIVVKAGRDIQVFVADGIALVASGSKDGPAATTYRWHTLVNYQGHVTSDGGNSGVIGSVTVTVKYDDGSKWGPYPLVTNEGSYFFRFDPHNGTSGYRVETGVVDLRVNKPGSRAFSSADGFPISSDRIDLGESIDTFETYYDVTIKKGINLVNVDQLQKLRSDRAKARAQAAKKTAKKSTQKKGPARGKVKAKKQ